MVEFKMSNANATIYILWGTWHLMVISDEALYLINTIFSFQLLENWDVTKEVSAVIYLIYFLFIYLFFEELEVSAIDFTALFFFR